MSTQPSYATDFVNNRGVADPVQVVLPAGTVDVIVRVREDGGRLDKLELVLVGAGSNTAPTVLSPGTQTNTAGQSVNLQINATDNAGGLTYSAVGLPPNLSINPTMGLITGTLTNNANTNSPYTVTVTVTDAGVPALSNSVTFGWTVNTTPPPSAQTLTSFTLINADTNQPIQTLSLTDGAVLHLSDLPPRINIRANTSPATVGSVVFSLSGAVNRTQTESAAPYALFSDNAGNYHPWTPVLGNYTLTARPYTNSSGGGTGGTPLTVSFQIVP